MYHSFKTPVKADKTFLLFIKMIRIRQLGVVHRNVSLKSTGNIRAGADQVPHFYSLCRRLNFPSNKAEVNVFLELGGFL